MKYIISIIRILFFALFLFLMTSGRITLWLVLFAASLVAALIFGRVFCGYVCPINTVMIPTERISKKLKLQKEKAPKWLKNGYFTWITLIISVAIKILGKRFFHIDIPILLFWMLISILITLRYKPAVFHNLICPFGALQRIFGRYAWFSERVKKDLCTGCKLCEKACPTNAIIVNPNDKKANIDIALCHQCTNCCKVCPRKAISYKR